MNQRRFFCSCLLKKTVSLISFIHRPYGFVPLCRTQMMTDVDICPVNFGSPVSLLLNLLTRNCSFTSFTVSLATLSESPARFQRETECGTGVIIYCMAPALIFTDMLYKCQPSLPCLFQTLTSGST